MEFKEKVPKISFYIIVKMKVYKKIIKRMIKKWKLSN